ncbi:MAG: YfcE family phosphodiesterase [Candidatus Lokiarchaeota archaeon]|nr:YfcE family phosphodiesterase [Candidatus Lokiarchaeota archaeon]
MHVLVIGDFHIPDRSFVIPDEIETSITRASKPHGFDVVACTGDLTRVDQMEPVLASWGQYLSVQGNMDDELRNTKHFPRKVTFDTAQEIPGADVLKIGIIHGHQVTPRGDRASLAEVTQQMGVHVLISGHTHAPSITLHQRIDDGKQVLLLNPGSATGAWSFVATLVPSFMLLDIARGKQGLNVDVTIIEIRDGKELKLSETHVFTNGTFIK